MSAVDCFWITATDRIQQWLRRYSEKAVCPVNGHYHQARVRIEDGALALNTRGYIESSGVWPHDDSRWPTACECGYPFPETDTWQLFIEQIYVTATGEEYTIRSAPPGAMWDAWWMRDGRPGDWVGPDGLSLTVKLPHGGEWLVDGPSTSGGGWTRTGTIPKVTATPSILAGAYHGWLRDGKLIEA